MGTDPGTQRMVRLHLGLLAACVICMAGFAVEVLRALGGNTLSWAYVFEWPFLCGYAFYMWHRLVVDELRRAAGLPEVARVRRAPRGVRARARAARRADDEAKALEAWNRYLRDANAAGPGSGRAP